MRTPLHDAAALGLLPVVRQLVKEGSSLTVRDAEGRTAYDCAIQYGHKRVAEYLASQQSNGESPAQVARRNPVLASQLSQEPATPTVPPGSKHHPRKPPSRLVKSLLGLLVLLAFSYYIWPTPYLYTTYQGSVRRVNRFTGVLEYSTDFGWRGRYSSASASVPVTDMLALVDNGFGEDADGSRTPIAWVKNNSAKKLRVVRLTFSVLSLAGSVLEESFVELPTIHPGDTVRVEVTVRHKDLAGSLRLDSATAIAE